MIYLIRHGKTSANLRGLYCGSTDLPLSQQGRQALEGLHYDLGDKESFRFYTSGMRRTDETMAILFPGEHYETIPALREIDFGIFEMHSYEELKDRPDYQGWITGDNRRNVPPGGESGEAMERRVMEAFDKLEKSGGNAVVVTHGGVIAAIMGNRFPEEGKNRYQWQPRPGEGYCLTAETYRKVPEVKSGKGDAYGKTG